MLANQDRTMNTQVTISRASTDVLYGSDEHELRVELAAAYRLLHHYGMTETIHGHISVRIQEKPAMFLLNPYGLLCDEICASNLVVVNSDGQMVGDTETEINQAGFTIHSAIHASRPDAQAIVHTHTISGMAIAAMEEGLLPLNQASMQFYNRIAYHAYEGDFKKLVK